MREEASAAEQRDARRGLARNAATMEGLVMLALLLEVALLALVYGFTGAS
jgi:hypothetical protein